MQFNASQNAVINPRSAIMIQLLFLIITLKKICFCGVQKHTHTKKTNITSAAY